MEAGAAAILSGLDPLLLARLPHASVEQQYLLASLTRAAELRGDHERDLVKALARAIRNELIDVFKPLYKLLSRRG